MTDAHAPTRFDFDISPEQAGQRLDRFLADAIGTLSRSRVKSLIEAGQVSCDGATTREPSETTRAGRQITLIVPPATPARPQAEDHDLPIIFEDRDLIVLDKPAGLVVHRRRETRRALWSMPCSAIAARIWKGSGEKNVRALFIVSTRTRPV